MLAYAHREQAWYIVWPVVFFLTDHQEPGFGVIGAPPLLHEVCQLVSEIPSWYSVLNISSLLLSLSLS